MASKKIFPSILKVFRQGKWVHETPTGERPVMDRYYEDHKTPDERMAEHQASVAYRTLGSDRPPGDPHTTRLQMRAKRGDERSLVRAMHDRTVKEKRAKQARSTSA